MRVAHVQREDHAFDHTRAIGPAYGFWLGIGANRPYAAAGVCANIARFERRVCSRWATLSAS
jgi:hypothetical protein